MVRLSAVVVALALCSAVSAGATSYPPVSFDELVTRADVIFAGEVIDVRPFPVQTADGPIVKTRVTFRVADPIAGTASALEVFEFFGGEWDGMGMGIAEMPAFAVGDRRVVFARRERSINPIVGFTQGLLQIRRDSAGVDRILTLGGVPRGQPDSIGTQRRGGAVTPAVPMRLSEFRDRVSRARAEARR